MSKGYNVYGLVRRTSVPRLDRIDYVLKDVKLIPGDLTDAHSLIEAMEVSKADEVYNLAAQSFVHASWASKISTGDITGLGATRVFEAVRRVNPKARVYQASSSELYGKVHEVPQNENTKFYPRSPYGVSKLYAHWIAINFRESYNMFVSSGILFNHECVSENTPVIIRKKNSHVISIRRIKDLRRPKVKGMNIQQWLLDDIEIWDGDQFVDLKCITATKRKKDNNDFNCKTINTRHGVVEVTNHHNMLLKDNTKVKALNVNIGQKILHKDFPTSDELSTLSMEEAVFLGMMVGDGYINENGKAQFSNNSKEIMNFFKALWMKVGLGTITVRKFKTEYGNAVQAKLNGNSSYLKLIRNEIYTYDGFKKVPDRILNSDNKIKLAFLRGYNLTDGLKSNPCTYEFKNFKTDSILLAQGLLFLISNTTKQNFNITFEYDEKNYGYYSINLLSPVDKLLKEKAVLELLEIGMGQRQICVETGISRTFIRKIQNGGQAQLVHHLSRQKEEVKKMFYHRNQPTWVFDVETASGKFMAGLGKITVSNSPRRGLEFVTRKITHNVAKIAKGLETKFSLGNLSAQRDWGFAGDYIKAMWLMLQHSEPDNFVIATNKTHSVRHFVELAFKEIGIDIEWVGEGVNEKGINKATGEVLVEVAPEFFRPADVDQLRGDYSKAKRVLGWEPKVQLPELVSMMVKHDLSLLENNKGPHHPEKVSYEEGS